MKIVYLLIVCLIGMVVISGCINGQQGEQTAGVNPEPTAIHSNDPLPTGVAGFSECKDPVMWIAKQPPYVVGDRVAYITCSPYPPEIHFEKVVLPDGSTTWMQAAGRYEPNVGKVV